jgi:hypothetical protein
VGELPLGRIDRASGKAGRVSITLSDLSYRQTGAGRRRWPYGEFGSDFIEALHAQLPRPRRQGLLRAKLSCPSCETSFEGAPVEVVTVGVRLDLGRVPPLGAEVEMPGIRCPRCGRPVVRIDDAAVDSDLSDAVIDAWRSVGLDEP